MARGKYRNRKNSRNQILDTRVPDGDEYCSHPEPAHLSGGEPLPKTEYRADEAEDSDNAAKKLFRWIGNRFPGAAVWGVIFSGILCYYTYLMVGVMEVTNETSRSTQRAYVSFENLVGGVGLRGDDPKKRVGQQVVVTWKNTGTTPTRHVQSNISYQAWPSELPDGFGFPDLNQSGVKKLAIGPGASQGVEAIIPAADLDVAWRGKSKLYFWGWIVYRDVFPSDPPRLTEFCAEMINISVPASKDGKPQDITDSNVPFTWGVRTCSQHNCYDKDCADYETRTKGYE